MYLNVKNIWSFSYGLIFFLLVPRAVFTSKKKKKNYEHCRKTNRQNDDFPPVFYSLPSLYRR